VLIPNEKKDQQSKNHCFSKIVILLNLLKTLKEKGNKTPFGEICFQS
jgi:hypothetical protein